MNYWTNLSVEYANQRNYLDELFRIYPTIPEGLREIDENIWKEVEKNFKRKDNVKLINSLLRLDLFPLKDSYVAYLRRDKSAILRNPETVNRLCGRIYEMGLTEVFEKCSEPKETNRQIGPLFKKWLEKKSLGLSPVGIDEFISSDSNAVLSASDEAAKEFAKSELNYTRDKGLDFIGRFNGKYVIGEAKFLTDFGGHQNAQFNDAVSIFGYDNSKAIPIAILDGVVYIKGQNKMFKDVTTKHKEKNIMSALVLREFLYQV